ncbi:MAG: PAS domain S-box protein [Phycisphaerae bacterium]|nr:PAS domain S-box protein [Phycisphaerae bacterium]
MLQSEERLRILVEGIDDALFVYDTAGRILDCNESACSWLGHTREELLALRIQDIDAPALAKGFEERLRRQFAHGRYSYEGLHVTKDGRRIPVHINTTVIDYQGDKAILAVVRDITDRKRAEDEKRELESRLRRAQKMEAIGQLVGGVAHDFNNILTAIMGNVELLRGHLSQELMGDDPRLIHLDQIEQASLRAASLTRQMLAFSRRQAVKREILNLNHILTEMEKMLRRLISKDILLELKLASDLALVHADAGQIEQVVMNLVVNARDAMPDGGRLTLETKNAPLGDSYVVRHSEACPGPLVLLTATDTGCGMSTETLERIFEPFFTTKPNHLGTGLGLATVYGIVKQMEGHIKVASELEHGTTFEIYLPAVDAEASRPSPDLPGDPSLIGSETVLVCEDEEAVRELAARFLQGAGYTVLTAETAVQAIKISAAHTTPIHLLVTDLILPDMNGKKLADTLHATNPHLKTLFVSGYTPDVIAYHGVSAAGADLLEKPFNRRGLLQRVRSALQMR